MIRRFAPLVALATLSTATLMSDTADACGGCFVPPAESTVVTGHRMALSISPTQAVLWDQFQYAGDARDFSWVLPVKDGARIEVAADAFFDVLDGATATTVQAPPEGCAPRNGGSGFGCSSMALSSAEDSAGAPNNGVQIIHEGTVGPYDTVTLSAENPNALTEWLTENGYSIPENIKPTIAAYVEENFNFIALKLQPGQGVAQMKPVRVVSPGGGYSLPLRMVAAGAAANVDIVLFIIGEGRYEARDYENVTIPPSLITWDFRTDSSDYSEQRLTALAGNDSRTWLTTYAQKGALLSPVDDPISGRQSGYAVGSDFQSARTIAGAYYMQGYDNGEGSTPPESCVNAAEQLASSLDVVVDTCDEEDNCGDPGPSEIDARKFECGELDDIAIALTGMHPADVSITRIEAHVPIEQLNTDLVVEAADDQTQIHNRFVAGLKVNACWDSEPAAVVPWLPRAPRNDRNPLPPGGLIVLTVGLAGLYLASRRLRTAAATR